MLQDRRRPLTLAWLTCLAIGAALSLQAAAQQDYSVDELRRIGDRCRNERDFQACIDRALGAGGPGTLRAPRTERIPSTPPPVTPAPPPEPDPPAIAMPRDHAPAEQAQEFCRAAMRYRDTELYAMWQVALERSRRGRVFEEARADLERTRREIEQALEYAEAAQVSLIVLQIVKLNADLIMDLLKLDPTLGANPVAQVVFEVYDRHRTIEDQVYEDVHKQVPDWLNLYLEKAHPKVKTSLDAVVNFAENAVRLGKFMHEPSLRKELERRLASTDRLLMQHSREVREGPMALRAIHRVKAAIERACSPRAAPPQSPLP